MFLFKEVAYKALLQRVRGWEWGSIHKSYGHYLAVITSWWTQDNLFQGGPSFRAPENRNTCASRLWIGTSTFAQTTTTPWWLFSLFCPNSQEEVLVLKCMEPFNTCLRPLTSQESNPSCFPYSTSRVAWRRRAGRKPWRGQLFTNWDGSVSSL